MYTNKTTVSQRTRHVCNRCLILKKADSKPCCESNSVSVPHKELNDVFIITAEHLLMLGLQVCASAPLFVRWTPLTCDRRIRGGGRFTRWWWELLWTARWLSCRGSSHCTRGTTSHQSRWPPNHPVSIPSLPVLFKGNSSLFVFNTRTWERKSAREKF